MPDSALNRRSEALGGWKANNASFGHQIIPRTLFREATRPTASNQGLVRFGETLASALAHNLLVAQLDYNCKQEKWMVLNLNRLLCVHFDLPLGYGLYKERPLKVLIEWLDHPYAQLSVENELV